MVLSLRLNVLQHGMELTRAYRKRAVATLPEKAAIPSIKRFDPFRGCFLYLFDELRLGDSSWQRRDNVNVISNTALRTQVQHRDRGRLWPDMHVRAAARLIRAKARDSWC